jgi:hypothetical protein
MLEQGSTVQNDLPDPDTSLRAKVGIRICTVHNCVTKKIFSIRTKMKMQCQIRIKCSGFTKTTSKKLKIMYRVPYILIQQQKVT